MKKREKFAYDIEIGAVMDYVEDRFILVIKDDEWTEEEIRLLKSGVIVNFCYTQDLAIFVVEGGDIDSSDFYFNIQECDWKDDLLKRELLDIELILVDGKNDVCWKKRKTLSLENSKVLHDCLEKQSKVQFMPGEYDVNVEGMQSAYEPFELIKYSKFTVQL